MALRELPAEEFESLFNQGEGFRESLKSVCEEVGLDLASLAVKGSFCCDVWGGPEIPALFIYKPNPFIVSETPASFFGKAEEDKKLAVLVEKVGCELILQSPLETLKSLAHKGIRVGLITWLNISPRRVNPDNVKKFFQAAKPLLKSGGAVILSVQAYGEAGDEIDGGYKFITSGNDAKEFGYKVDFPDTLEKPFKSAGQVFIVATNI